MGTNNFNHITVYSVKFFEGILFKLKLTRGVTAHAIAKDDVPPT